MKLLPNETPRPRLLSSVVSSLPPTFQAPSVPAPESGGGFFRTHHRAFLVGTLVGALFILGGIYVLTRQNSMHDEAAAVRRLIAVATRTLSSSTHASTPPAPVIVQLNSDLVQVSGIALGHPRLAVVNGKQVAEGDTITVHTPTRSIAVTLRVLKIADGRVDFSDGTQTLSARLVMPKPSK